VCYREAQVVIKGMHFMRLSLLKRLWTKRRPSRFLKNQQGVAAIEFAFLGPIFGVAMFCIFETGYILYTEYVMQTAVQEAARLVRTGRAQEKKWDAAKFKDAVCYLAGRVSHCEDRLTVYMQTATSFTALQASTPAYLSIGPNSYSADSTGKPQGPYNCGNPRDVVALIATYDWDIHLPIFMSNFANLPGDDKRRIVAFAMFRNEQFPSVPGNVCQASTPSAPS
jgi:Flp pilus assembly protein TadG